MNQSLDIRTSALLKVALPLSFGAFVQFVVVFIDNFFVARINGNAMSAVSFVGLIYITLAMIGVGLSNGAQIIIARRKGEQQYLQAGQVFATTFWLAVGISFVQFFLLRFVTPAVVREVIASESVRSYMIEFIEYRSFGFFFYSLTLVFVAFWAGIANTRVMAYETAITALVTIALDYALVLGNWGFPQWGVKGAAIATIIAEACALIFLVIYTFVHREGKQYSLRACIARFQFTYFSNILRLGGPIILQMVLALAIWLVFYDLVEKLGEQSMQSAWIVRNMYMLAWVSVMGFATTTKTYVSGLIAEGRQSELGRLIRRIILLNVAGVFILAHGLWLYPAWISGQFTSDPLTLDLAVRSMYIVFPAILVYSVTSILLGVVEGSGNTTAGFVIELLTSFFYLASAWLFAIHWKLPVDLVWTADYVYFICIGIFSLWFLKSGRWKQTHV